MIKVWILCVNQNSFSTYKVNKEGLKSDVYILVLSLLDSQRAELFEEIKQLKKLKELPNYWGVVDVLDSLTMRRDERNKVQSLGKELLTPKVEQLDKLGKEE